MTRAAEKYLSGLRGVAVLGDDARTSRAILIRVKNAGELARSQGAVASIAQAILPATVEGKVYDTMADELRKSLKEKHVDADVSVVDPVGWKPANGGHIWTDVGFAIGGAGLFAIAWTVVASLRGRK